MGWNKITIDTLTSAEDMISYELTELGATGVEVEDHVSLTEEEMKVMYVDLLPDDIAPDDGKAKISCYFDENENLEHITMQIQAMLERLRGFLEQFHLIRRKKKTGSITGRNSLNRFVWMNRS